MRERISQVADNNNNISKVSKPLCNITTRAILVSLWLWTSWNTLVEGDKTSSPSRRCHIVEESKDTRKIKVELCFGAKCRLQSSFSSFCLHFKLFPLLPSHLPSPTSHVLTFLPSPTSLVLSHPLVHSHRFSPTWRW